MGYHLQAQSFDKKGLLTYAYDCTEIVGIETRTWAKTRRISAYDSPIGIATEHPSHLTNKGVRAHLAQSTCQTPSHSHHYDSTNKQPPEYDDVPLRELRRATGSNKDECSFRLSNKDEDTETGLFYYGFRYYDPVTGRWPNRDPIGERGGLNLYGMVGNNPVNLWDYLGMAYFEPEWVAEGATYDGRNLWVAAWLRNRETLPDVGWLVESFQVRVLAWEGKSADGTPLNHNLGFEERNYTLSSWNTSESQWNSFPRDPSNIYTVFINTEKPFPTFSDTPDRAVIEIGWAYRLYDCPVPDEVRSNFTNKTTDSSYGIFANEFEHKDHADSYYGGSDPIPEGLDNYIESNSYTITISWKKGGSVDKSPGWGSGPNRPGK